VGVPVCGRSAGEPARCVETGTGGAMKLHTGRRVTNHHMSRLWHDISIHIYPYQISVYQISVYQISVKSCKYLSYLNLCLEGLIHCTCCFKGRVWIPLDATLVALALSKQSHENQKISFLKGWLILLSMRRMIPRKIQWISHCELTAQHRIWILLRKYGGQVKYVQKQFVRTLKHADVASWKTVKGG
jgi:hypothetical protein